MVYCHIYNEIEIHYKLPKALFKGVEAWSSSLWSHLEERKSSEKAGGENGRKEIILYKAANVTSQYKEMERDSSRN